MKKVVMMAIVCVFLMSAGLPVSSPAEMAGSKTGEELFKDNCTICHPDGGNIINPSKSLRKADLQINGIRTKSDIVDKMRHPGKGMSTWSAATLPDSDAEAIADYILKTFR